jgi:hypothetical protein
MTQDVNKARRAIGFTERGLIASAWNNKCAYCKTTNGPFAVDHIVPHSASGTCDVDNLCWACSKCNAQKSDTRLPIFQEGLLISLAARRAKAIKEKLKAAETVVRPKAKKKNVKKPPKPFVELIDIPDTSFATHLSLSQLSEAYKLLSLILSKGITEKREARWPETLPARVWFESAFVLPLGIANPWDLLKEIKYFGKREDEGCYGGPHLISECEKCTETGEVQFRFTLPMKELKKLKKGITTVLNQAKEAA